MFARHYSATDRVLIELERALGSAFGTGPIARRPSPAAAVAEGELSDAERRQAAGLMRVNHAGEVCAQALYSGQAAVARTPDTRARLLEAAAEEADHLAWCEERLAALQARPSLLNPLWYLGSFVIGAVAALASDRVSLGFVVETERQVEAHLGEHLARLPERDAPSRAVLAQMQLDEARHGQAARAAGGIDLPPPVPALMRLAAGVMKTVAYRL
jgi:ubiquinone biosynthesis monooxygenase Coq7